MVKLLGEASIGSGVRRVEALVGGDAYRFLAREHVLVAQLTEALKVRPEELPERVDDIVERLRAAEKEIEKVRVGAAARRRRARSRRAPQDVARRQGRRRTAPTAPAGGDVRTLALDVRGRLPAGQPGRGGRHRRHGTDGKVVGRGGGQRRGARPRRRAPTRWSARSARCVGGKGGGKDDVAQGGGTDASRIDEALALVRDRGRRAPSGRAEALRHGVRLGLDPGDARIGVASSDPSGFLATPVETVRRGEGDLAGSRRSPEEAEAVEVVVGLPRSLSGREGPAAEKVREFAASLARRAGTAAGAAVSTSG